MKDWKYINGAKVGNSLVLRDGKYIIEQLEQSSTDKYAEKYFGMKKGNYCLKNTKTGVVLGWYTTLDAAKKSMEKWKDDDKVWGNSKTGNALKYSNYSDAMAMWKQRDWSKTLAEKENGHSSPVREQVAIYKKDDTFYVMERQEASSKGMSDLEVFPIKRIKNSKTGNSKFSSTSEQELKSWIRMNEQDIKDAERGLQKLPSYRPSDKSDYINRQERDFKIKIEEAKKAIKDMQDELAKRKIGNQDGVARMFEGLVKDENKEVEKDSGAIEDLEKVGNATTGDFTNLINRANKVAKEKPEKASRMKEIVSFLKSAHNLPSDRWQYHVDRLDKEISVAENSKIGNKDGVARMFEGLVKDENKEVEKDSGTIEELEKVGNAKDKNGKDLRIGDIVLVWTSSGERAGKVKAISGDRITVDIRNEGEWSTPGKLADKVSNSKVGNAYGSKEDIISHLDTDLYDIHQKLKDKNAPSFAYASELLKKGYDYATLSKYNKKIGEIVDRYKNGNKCTGNSKIGNSTVSEYNAEIQRLTKKAEQLRRMGQGRQAMEVEKQIEKLGKELSEIGNSASDDKFAYVMREFEAGKLKTPDGKVVTNPEQAKAIAYSESKKTENGLARARKAIH